MQTRIINIGLILCAGAFLLRFDSRVDRIALPAITALSLCLCSLYRGELRLSSKVVLAFLGYILFVTWKAVKPTNMFSDMALPYFAWLPIAMIVLYMLMYAGIKRNARHALPVICWVGFIASCYCILQYFGIDSPIVATDRIDLNYVKSSNVVAWFGHPVAAGCSIAMIIPLVLKLKKWFMVPFMVAAVILTKSDMAIGSMVCSLATLPFLGSKKLFFLGVLVFICLISLLYVNRSKIKIQDSGRFGVWSNIIDDMQKTVTFERADGSKYQRKFGLFGYGLGSYKYIFHDNHPSESTYQSLKAHNEYLHVFYELGIIAVGFVLFILLSHIFKQPCIYIKSSLICICLSALGFFVWQLGLTQFLTVYLLGLSKGE